MKCPFQFYVANVLQVAEEPEDENSRSPLERGRFLHELFETFFHEWQARGRGRITSREMADARGVVRGDCRAGAAIVVAGRSGARARAAARLGRRVRHCRSRVRDGSRTRRRDPRATDGVRARRRVHVRRRRRRDAGGAAAREDRSRRRARRRHVPVDRLQDQVRARSPNGAAVADLQPLREPDAIRAARPRPSPRARRCICRSRARRRWCPSKSAASCSKT